jgi:hypothetical protein
MAGDRVIFLAISFLAKSKKKLHWEEIQNPTPTYSYKSAAFANMHLYLFREESSPKAHIVQENQIIFVLVEIGCTDSTLRLPRENIPGATRGTHNKINIIYNGTGTKHNAKA